MDEDILEKLADLEHQQWCEWSSSIARELSSLLDILDNFENDLSDEDKSTILHINNKLARWESLWVDYSELSEDEKEKDRVYARKSITVFEE